MRRLLVLASLCALIAPADAARPLRPSMLDSFRLGTGGDTLCQVQRRSVDAAAPGLFDRAYAIVCRDAASSVGRLYAVRSGEGAVARIDAARGEVAGCAAVPATTLSDVGAVAVRSCTTSGGVPYDVLTAARGGTLYVAEGLAGYRSALELGLRTLVADRIVTGPITIATSGAGDPVSFARAQAGSIDPSLALAEAYRRNNAGSYAEASEFFDTLLQRTSGANAMGVRSVRDEYLLNRALQQSDLGNYDAADALFAEAGSGAGGGALLARRQRNYAALDRINRGDWTGALATLDRPLADQDGGATGGIDATTADALNADAPLAAQLGGGPGAALTPAERAQVMDAQADVLRGGVLRRAGRHGEAAAALDRSLAEMARIRDGQVTSLARLRAQTLTEQAALAETAGRLDAAQALLRQAVAAVAVEYPDSFTLDAARARLASFLARHGQDAEALALYREVTRALGGRGGASSAFAGLLDPYFTLLLRRMPADAALADDLFVASQVLLRPGVADTQATLARELSAGSGEGARLFRQSLNQAREVNVARVELSRLLALATPTRDDVTAIAVDRTRIEQLAAEQSATQAQLTNFPAYRAIATQSLTLADLRAALRPGETYWKLTAVGPSLYAMLVTRTASRAWRVPFGTAELARRVDALRATIATVQEGVTVTPPFDAAAARALYVALAGPADADLRQAHHVIFEPDGAMTRLPVTLLIEEQAGLDRYLARVKRPDSDAFDMRGIAWLGARADVSVALSPRAFRDVRAAPSSKAAGAYLGFGENAPLSPFLQLTGYVPPASAIDCRWPLAAWSHPISAGELDTARAALRPARTDVVTGARFTDSAIVARGDLADYRVVHFATHGLVVAPRPQCPADPALLTSWGGKGSDGLLGFGEIYGLRLDADLVLLSACDTAGTADVAATQAAGLTSGGGNALDGLVRAFIGAGARSVLASHWPAPDAYGATRQLIEGLFTAPRGTATAEALRQSALRLQARAETSHPYYWAGFALIGDGARPATRP